MDILTEAGASLSQDEESGVLHVQRAPLRLSMLTRTTARTFSP